MNRIFFSAAVTLLVAVLHHALASGSGQVSIDAAFNDGEDVVLISGRKKMVIQMIKGQGKEKRVERMRSAFRVKAAYKTNTLDDEIWLYGRKRGQIFYVKTSRSRRLRYGKAKKFIRKGGPDAVGARGGALYFFKGCEMVIRHRWNSWSKPEKVRRKGLPCTPEAAWSDGEDMIILKGGQIWRWTKSGNVRGPNSFSDTYSITSWNIGTNNKDKGNVCAEGWTMYVPSKKCFRVFTDKKDAVSANEDCKKHGGNLATIRYADDQYGVGEMIHYKLFAYWIGANDRVKEGDYRWFSDNDSRVVFTNWNNGEPNNGNGGPKENCVEIYGSHLTWNDMPCDTKLPYVCDRYPD